MPRKCSIDKEAFQNALKSLSIDQIRLLSSSTSSSDIWGHFCKKMGIPDSEKNRRACFDLCRRDSYGVSGIINDISLKAAPNNTIESSNIISNVSIADALNTLQTISDISQSQITNNGKTNNSDHQHLLTKSVYTQYSDCDINDKCPTNIVIMEQNQQAIEELNRILYEQQKQKQKEISIKYSHNSYSATCSGDIEAVLVLCACAQTPESTNLERETNQDLYISTVSSQQQMAAEQKSNTISFITNKNTATTSLSNIEHHLVHNNNNIILTATNNTDAGVSTTVTSDAALQSSQKILSFSPSTNISNQANFSKSPSTSNTFHSNTISHLIKRTKSFMSPKKTFDHADINDEQRDTLIYLQRQTNENTDFTKDIEEIQKTERELAIVVSQADMNKLKELRLNSTSKEN